MNDDTLSLSLQAFMKLPTIKSWDQKQIEAEIINVSGGDSLVEFHLETVLKALQSMIISSRRSFRFLN